MTTNPDSMLAAEPDTGVEQTGAPEQSAAPAADTAQVEPTTHADSPAPAAPNPQTDESLTTSPKETQPAAQPATPQSAQPDWSKEGPVLQKRYEDIRADYNRKINQWQQTYQQQSTQLTELQKFKQEQEQRAQAASLKPWSKLHPEHSKFNSMLDRAKTVERQLQGIDPSLPPEQQAAIKNAITSALSPEERAQIMEYRDSVQNFQRDLVTDPQGTLMPMVDKLVEQRMEQFMQRQKAEESVQRDFADPQLAPLIEKYSSDFKQALDEGVPYKYTTHMMKMHANTEAMAQEVARLKAELAKAGVKVESADARQRLVKGEAAITRDPRPPVRDSYELAKTEGRKRGITPDSPQFAALLAKYQQST